MQSRAEYDAEWKWLQTPEADKLSAAAKAKALSYFKQRYPNADMDAFKVRVNFDKNRKATGEVLFVDNKGGWDGSLISVFGSDRKYWPQAMISTLGLHHDGGFPFQLTLNTNNTSPTKPIPAVDFSENINKAMQVGDVLNKEQKYYVTPTEFFTTKFRQIFKDTHITFTHDLFATAAKLRRVVRNNRHRNFSRNTIFLHLLHHFLH